MKKQRRRLLRKSLRTEMTKHLKQICIICIKMTSWLYCILDVDSECLRSRAVLFMMATASKGEVRVSRVRRSNPKSEQSSEEQDI
jgi:hypothetical protein